MPACGLPHAPLPPGERVRHDEPSASPGLPGPEASLAPFSSAAAQRDARVATAESQPCSGLCRDAADTRE